MTAPEYCPNCGQAVQQNATYCSHCGHALTEDAEPSPPARPPRSSSQADENRWAAIVHLAGFAGFVIPAMGSVIGPLIVWIMMKEQIPLVDRHGRAALNFQISMLIYEFFAAILIIVLIGIPILIGLFFFWVTMTIVAGVRASNGNEPGYIGSIKFLKET